MIFVWFILIGIATGWLAGQITSGGGCGVLGALLGGFLFRLLGIVAVGLPESLITATIDAIVLIVVLWVIKRGDRLPSPSLAA